MLHFFNGDRDGPDPVGVDEEEPVKKLKAGVVGVELTYFGQHDGDGCSSEVPVDLRIDSFVLGPHLDGLQSLSVVFVFLDVVVVQVDCSSIAVNTSDFLLLDIFMHIDVGLLPSTIKEMRVLKEKGLIDPGEQ